VDAQTGGDERIGAIVRSDLFGEPTAETVDSSIACSPEVLLSVEAETKDSMTFELESEPLL